MVKKLVGIQYEAGFRAPKVTVKALGVVAEKIIGNRISESDKRLIENKELLDALFSIPLDHVIDDSLFEAIAILLVHIYSVDSAVKNKNRVLG